MLEALCRGVEIAPTVEQSALLRCLVPGIRKPADRDRYVFESGPPCVCQLGGGQVAEDLPNALRNPMPDPPVGSSYSAGMYTVERLAALCAIANPALALNCAKVLSRQGDHFGAASVVLARGSSTHSGQAPDDSHALIVWALQELVPKLGMQSLEPVLLSLQPEMTTPQVFSSTYIHTLCVLCLCVCVCVCVCNYTR